ncbi:MULTISPECIES: hypothetical protein [unclassified Streptomyces]|uniref:hypothetical protein n=1 Tax=unclassified Streptomyces TaxID=2593676 RepID=UPI0034129746
MNLRLWVDMSPSIPTMGRCFMCRRGYLAVVAVGELTTSSGGPGHQALDVPLYACRACESWLLLLGADAQRSAVRPYVSAGPPQTPAATRLDGLTAGRVPDEGPENKPAPVPDPHGNRAQRRAADKEARKKRRHPPDDLCGLLRPSSPQVQLPN